MKQNIYIILSCVILSSCDLIQSMVDPANQYRDVSEQEKYALMYMYQQTDGCDWTNNTNALKQDRKQKQEYIDSLDKKDYNKYKKKRYKYYRYYQSNSKGS